MPLTCRKGLNVGEYSTVVTPSFHHCLLLPSLIQSPTTYHLLPSPSSYYPSLSTLPITKGGCGSLKPNYLFLFPSSKFFLFLLPLLPLKEIICIYIYKRRRKQDTEPLTYRRKRRRRLTTVWRKYAMIPAMRHPEHTCTRLRRHMHTTGGNFEQIIYSSNSAHVPVAFFFHSLL
jgi:hypothetical protein